MLGIVAAFLYVLIAAILMVCVSFLVAGYMLTNPNVPRLDKYAEVFVLFMLLHAVLAHLIGGHSAFAWAAACWALSEAGVRLLRWRMG